MTVLVVPRRQPVWTDSGGVRLSRWGYQRGEVAQRYTNGCTCEARHSPNPTRGLATSVGVPLADWGDGEPLGTPNANRCVWEPSLVLNGRSPLRAMPVPSLPAGIRKSAKRTPRARPAHDARARTVTHPCGFLIANIRSFTSVAARACRGNGFRAPGGRRPPGPARTLGRYALQRGRTR